MKILTVGDVVFQPGLQILQQKLRAVQKKYCVDFTIVNGENASGVGVTPDQVEQMFDAGADLVTLGNHVYGKRQIVPYLDDCAYVLRPANYAPQQPGRGWGIFDCAGWRLLVMNLIGRCDMKFGADNPFLLADRILRDQAGQFDAVVCEIHANATSEKLAMGYYLDGRCGAVYGTHTHVQTADNRVLPKGCGYITDLVTLGNHVYGKRQIVPYLDDCAYVLRPANYAPQQPGRGWGIFDCAGWRLLVMNLIGRCDMKFGADNPFLLADRILRDQAGQFDAVVCEIHANATSEKLAMGYYLDGRCGAVYGTHTHVQTADNRVLPKGCGYITDLGMTGPLESVLGVEPKQSIAMFRGDLTEYFRPASGEIALMGAVFELDPADGTCRSVERVWETIGG